MMLQQDLFIGLFDEPTPPRNYGGKYPHQPATGKTDTSREAAEAIAPRSANLRERVLELLKTKPRTADECSQALGETAFSVRPRLTELSRLSLIIDTNERRKNKSGKNAIVWAAR